MSLVKSPALTPEKLAANQANGRESHGPVTTEGLDRCRDVPVKHGFYVQRPGEALRILGEDPDEFNRLLDSLRASWQPSDEFQRRLVERLARALWRLERSDRVQDSIAVRQVWAVNRELDGLVDDSLGPYDRKLRLLEGLVEGVSGEQFVSSGDDFADFNAVFSDPTQGRAAEILDQLFKLIDPETDEDSDPDALMRAPDVPVATGAGRTEACQQMKSLLRDEIKAVTEARQRDREARLEDNAPYFRDSAIPASGPEAAAVFRIEGASFRQVTRFTDLLLRLKLKEARAGEVKKTKNEGGSHDVDDNKGPISGTHDVDENKVLNPTNPRCC